MEINPHIFRAYDIRGIAYEDLSPDAMFAIGRAFGTYMSAHHPDYPKKIMCGRDNRLSGEELQRAFIAGVLASGYDVIDIGLATSPLLYYATCKYDVAGGANITASHNPKEYNGVKLVAKNAHSICGEELQAIKRIACDEEFSTGTGEVGSREVFEDYVNDVLNRIQLKKKYTVVIDAGNGVAGAFAPALLRRLGCEVVELFCELDGNYPNHEANPEYEENLTALQKKVIETGADMGFGFDGDGDRVGVIDGKGVFRHADYLLIPLARDLLSRYPGGDVIFDTKTSKVVEDDITAHGGNPVRFKTGHSFIETRMRDTGALLAGETSGHLFFAENYFGFDDALFAACKLLETVDRAGHSFSQFFTGLPKVFTTPEIKLPCSDERKFEIVEDVKEFFTKRYPCLTIDGVWIDFGKGNWAACRASNTSPYLTLRFEAREEKEIELMKAMVYGKLREYPEVGEAPTLSA